MGHALPWSHSDSLETEAPRRGSADHAQQPTDHHEVLYHLVLQAERTGRTPQPADHSKKAWQKHTADTPAMTSGFLRFCMMSASKILNQRALQAGRTGRALQLADHSKILNSSPQTTFRA